jgi:GNAT superfamily N-acetyltransferase
VFAPDFAIATMTKIRPATPIDAAALAELRWEFRSAKTPPVEPHERFVSRCAMWMRDELERERWRAWVAEDEERVVGQLWLQLVSKLPNPAEERERHAYISNVYVMPAARGGVGARLLQTALDWASSHDVDRVILWPTPRSRALYERHGFRVSGNVLELTCR